MNLNKKVAIFVEVMNLYVRGKFKSDRSFGNFFGFELNDFLQVKIINVVDNPFDLYMSDVDFRGHGKEVNDLVGHEFSVIAGLIFHQLFGLVLEVL